jgi:hypothetical protein
LIITYGYIANIYAVGSIGYVPIRNEPDEFRSAKGGRREVERIFIGHDIQPFEGSIDWYGNYCRYPVVIGNYCNGS